MKIIDFCKYDKLVGYKRIESDECDEYNRLFSQKKVTVVIDKFSLSTHPVSAYVSINIGEEPIIKLHFNYVGKFYGYPDKWENTTIEIFRQEETLGFKKIPIRNLVTFSYVLYDKENHFIIKSHNLYQW